MSRYILLLPLAHLVYLLIAKRSGIGPSDIAYLAFTFAFCTWAPLMMKAFSPKVDTVDAPPEHE